MKAVVLMRRADEPVDAVPMALVADSALSFDRRPMVLPDIDGLQMAVCPAYRIGRLGKGVAPRYAWRYVDAVTAVAVVCDASGYPLGLADDSLALGTWRPVAEDAAAEDVDVDGVKLTPSEVGIADAIARVSHVAQVKTGDIIIPVVAKLTAATQGFLEIKLDGTPAMTKKVL